MEIEPKRDGPVDKITVQTAEGDLALDVIFRDEGGEPWLCRNDEGFYTNKIGVMIIGEDFMTLVRLGAINIKLASGNANSNSTSTPKE